MNTSKLDNEIAGLEREINTLTDRVSALRTKLFEKRIERISLLYNIHIGDIVRRQGKEFRVVTIEASAGILPWLEGNPRKKDGSWGTARRALYGEWEKV